MEGKDRPQSLGRALQDNELYLGNCREEFPIKWGYFLEKPNPLGN
jgi:hypothetical protein